MQVMPLFSQISEDSLIVEWPLKDELPLPEDALYIGAIAKCLLEDLDDLLLNVTPAYQSIMIQFDLVKTDFSKVSECVLKIINRVAQSSESIVVAVEHQIPVFYDARVADDLLLLCAAKKLTPEQLISEHISRVYTVHAVGFQPGFAYLGYVSEALATSRHASFRSEVAAGSVAIADRQTAVYPQQSPGGWNIIGRTPMSMINGLKSRLQTGNTVQFYSIDEDAYLRLGGQLS